MGAASDVADFLSLLGLLGMAEGYTIWGRASTLPAGWLGACRP